MLVFIVFLFGFSIFVLVNELVSNYWVEIVALFQYLPHLIRNKKRETKITRQKREHLNFLVLSLKSGSSLSQSLKDYIDYAPQPLKEYLLRRLQKIELNNLREVIHCLFEEKQNQTLRSFLIYSSISGAPVSSKIDALINTLKQKDHFSQKAQALSAQTRASAWIIGLIPFIFLIMFSVFNPEYLAPLFQSMSGILMLFFSIGMSVLGLYFVQKLGKLQ